MWKKLRLKLAKVVPFMRWIAKDLEKGDAKAAREKIKQELEETLNEIEKE